MQENATVRKHKTRMLVPRAKLISRIKSFVRCNWRSFLWRSRATLERPLFVDVGIEEWGTNWSRANHGLKFRCTWESCPQQDKRSNIVLQAGRAVKELCMWMAMPNSGSMEAFENIGAMCSSASKKEGASW